MQPPCDFTIILLQFITLLLKFVQCMLHGEHCNKEQQGHVDLSLLHHYHYSHCSATLDSFLEQFHFSWFFYFLSTLLSTFDISEACESKSIATNLNTIVGIILLQFTILCCCYTNHLNRKVKDLFLTRFNFKIDFQTDQCSFRCFENDLSLFDNVTLKW